jgi:hypothetical protein
VRENSAEEGGSNHQRKGEQHGYEGPFELHCACSSFSRASMRASACCSTAMKGFVGSPWRSGCQLSPARVQLPRRIPDQQLGLVLHGVAVGERHRHNQAALNFGGFQFLADQPTKVQTNRHKPGYRCTGKMLPSGNDDVSCHLP